MAQLRHILGLALATGLIGGAIWLLVRLSGSGPSGPAAALAKRSHDLADPYFSRHWVLSSFRSCNGSVSSSKSSEIVLADK